MTPTGYKNGDFFPPIQHSFHTSKVVFGYQKCRHLKKDPSGVGIFSKCPLTVCVWADKNVGYDDDIHHTAHALKEFMYFARLSVVVRTGENDSYTIRVEEKRSKRLCFKKYSDT